MTNDKNENKQVFLIANRDDAAWKDILLRVGLKNDTAENRTIF